MGSGEVQHFWQKTDLRLCRAKRVTYAHLDLRDLEMKLRESRARVKLIVTDGVFSMDAEVNLRFNFELSLYSLKQQFQTHYNFHPSQDFSCQVAPLLQLRQLADQYGASLHLDDAHATGVFHQKLWTTGKNILILTFRGKISSMIFKLFI